MNKIVELIERIRDLGGIVVVTETGLYSRGGTFIAFPYAKGNKQYHATRNNFLQKFCVPFTKDEVIKIRTQRIRHLRRYERMMAIGIAKHKYASVEELSRRAQELYERLQMVGYEQYYHLKDYRLEN